MSKITDLPRRAMVGLALAIATLATALTIGAAPAQSAATAGPAQAQPDDVYCDVVLPALRKLGYAGEDPLCTA